MQFLLCLRHSNVGLRHSNVADWHVQSVNPELVTASWNVMAHAQKPDFVFRRNGRVHLNRWGRQFGWLLAAEVCASAVVMVLMLDTPRTEVVWRVLATHSIRQFPLHFPSRASPCAVTFQLDSTLRTVAKSTLSLQYSQMFRTSRRFYSFTLSRVFLSPNFYSLCPLEVRHCFLIICYLHHFTVPVFSSVYFSFLPNSNRLNR